MRKWYKYFLIKFIVEALCIYSITTRFFKKQKNKYNKCKKNTHPPKDHDSIAIAMFYFDLPINLKQFLWTIIILTLSWYFSLSLINFEIITLFTLEHTNINKVLPLLALWRFHQYLCFPWLMFPDGWSCSGVEQMN